MLQCIELNGGLIPKKNYGEPALDSSEEAAVYEVLEAINPEINWKSSYPDNLCTGGPHGIVCDIDKDKEWHIVEINLGWVSEYSNNPICGRNASFSPLILKFPLLRKLFFYKCFTSDAQLTVIPPYIWTLGSHLQELVFQDNPSLYGILSADIGNLVRLKRLILTGTNVGGALPAEIGRLKGLQQLVLSGNLFNGSITSDVGELQDLVILDLSRNRLDGQVPRELGKLKKLSKLDVSLNKLSGIMPDSLGQLGGSLMTDVSYNNFPGGIPSFLRRMPGLRDIHLSGNPLGGLIPDLWDKLSGLESIGLSNANLAGRIPETMGKLKNLTYLALDRNRLLGTIPRNLGSLPGIYNMDLSGNLLTGPAPFCAEFIWRLGSKLQLKENPGLCVDADLGSLNVVVLNLSYCDEIYFSEPIAQEKHEVILKSAASTSVQAAWGILHLMLYVYVICVTSLLTAL
eukprot:PITA_20475